MSEHVPLDDRYLQGIEYFNAGDYFEAHEVWEDWWHDTAGPNRRFIQGLIQAAVAIYHAGNGNVPGTRRLFHSARRYMSNYPVVHLGFDVVSFWKAMESALADFVASDSIVCPQVRYEQVPRIFLSRDIDERRSGID